MDFKEIEQPDGSIQVTLDGKPLTCLVCGNNCYHERGSMMNTRVREFFNVAWTGDKATNFVCTNCGYVFWFLI
ncbi:MAG: hypothetical protein ABSC08_13050 [Bryobacteraceae bacterium]|jgi:predicted nucleic-acid-binding Zn-ribbon protein